MIGRGGYPLGGIRAYLGAEARFWPWIAFPGAGSSRATAPPFRSPRSKATSTATWKPSKIGSRRLPTEPAFDVRAASRAESLRVKGKDPLGEERIAAMLAEREAD